MTVWRKCIIFFILILLLAICVPFAFGAENASTVHALMGKSSNPASIGTGYGNFRFRVIPADVAINTGHWSLAILNKMQHEDDLLNLPQSLLDVVGDGRFSVNASMQALTNVEIGRFSAGFSLRSVVETAIGHDVLSAMAEGFVSEQHYDFAGTRFGGIAFGDASVAASWPLTDHVVIGGRYHRLIGLQYFDAYFTGGGLFSPAQSTWKGNVKLRLDEMSPDDPHGVGHAFDAGIVWQLSPNVALAATIADVGYIDLPMVARRQYGAEFQAEQNEQGIHPDLELENEETRQTMRWNLPVQYETAMYVDLIDDVQAALTFQRIAHREQDAFVQTSYNEMLGHIRWQGKTWRPTVTLRAQYSRYDEWRFAGSLGWKAGPFEVTFGTNDFRLLSHQYPLGLVVDFRVLI